MPWVKDFQYELLTFGQVGAKLRFYANEVLLRMPQIVELLCPRCGATLVPEASASFVRCRFCDAVSGVEPTRVQPVHPYAPAANAWPQGQAGSALPPTNRDTSTNAVKHWAWMSAAFAAVPVLFWAARFYVGNTNVVAGTSSTVTAISDSGIAIKAQNLHAVDPADLIRQAASEARRRQPSATQAYGFFYHLQQGAFDSTGSLANILLTFTYRATDPSKPPGQDVHEAGFDVTVRDGKFYLRDTIKSGRPEPVWPEPLCPFADAWRAAVQSGVPENAVVDVYYRESPSSRHQGQVVWSISVTGHNEWDRYVDMTTCKIVSR